MAKFYNEIKFPNFDNLESFAPLIEKGSSNLFTAQLDQEIPARVTIVEAGCGTGQLSLFLSRYSRLIYGVDLSIGSLSLAESFRIRNERSNLLFSRATIFDLPFKASHFDLVISNGVLHHTSAKNEQRKGLKPNHRKILD